MGVSPYRFDPGRAESFIDFSTTLYQDDTKWIAPFRSTVRAQFDPTFAFYHKPGNTHRHFLATVAGRVVGHLSAVVNTEMRNKTGIPIGALGFFECIRDRYVAQALLAQATDWLRTRGLSRLWGPVNFDIWTGYRLQSRGFDQTPFYGEPHAKPYYVDLFQEFGFEPLKNWHSLTIPDRASMNALASDRADYLAALLDQGYRFESFDVRRATEQSERLHAVMVDSFKRFTGVTPLSAAEFAPMFATQLRVMDPQLVTLIYDEAGETAGFSVAYPDLSEAVRAMRGRNTLAAKFRFLRRRGRTRRAVFYLLGITQEEARKRRGTGRAIFCHTLRQILSSGYDSLIAALIAEGNPSRGLFDAYASQKNRQYTLYEMNS
jgi:hypothetical protein